MGCSGSKQEMASVKQVNVELDEPNAPQPVASATPDTAQPAAALAVLLPATKDGKALDFDQQNPTTEDLSAMSAPATQKPSSEFNVRMSNPVVSSAKQYSSMSDLHSHVSADSRRMTQRRKTDVNSIEIERFEKFTKAKELTRKRGRLAISSETISKAKANARMAAWKEQQNKSAQVAQWLVELLVELFMFRSFSSE